ncbi:MAG TPA: biopolymer transporter ExbD [Sedimentisphaerales bacterium]|nr:biopolymer transporter ExbD [Sedimentisphaerales bacterium]
MLFESGGQISSGREPSVCSLRTAGRSETGFNMTPIIDIVFLLIIFFLVVCRFIEAENFPVTVPDGCRFAADLSDAETAHAAVTVMKTAKGQLVFAVGSEKITTGVHAKDIETAQVAVQLGRLIDSRLKNLPVERRVVALRIDRDIDFAQAQYALAGVAASSARDIQLAALKHTRAVSE